MVHIPNKGMSPALLDVISGNVQAMFASVPGMMHETTRIRPIAMAELKRSALLPDLATMDDSGYVFIVDRKKDLVISSGHNIYPREIEEVLYEHYKVHDAADIGVPHPKKGETIKIFIVPKHGESIDRQEILDWCRERLAPYKVPREVEFRDSLPKTIVGKVLRRELREEELAARRLAAENE